MGLIRLIPVLLFLCVAQAQGQSSITSFEANAEWDEITNAVNVVENIGLKVENGDSHVTLQSIAFNDTEIQDLHITINNELKSISLSENENGLLEITIPIGTAADDIELTYQVLNNETSILVPLIFTPLTSGSTNENLFSATLKIPSSYELVESFPTVVEEVVQIENRNIYKIMLPVIPSLLKMKLSKGSGFKLSITQILDGVVITILVMLAIIGWKNRKILT